jgi:chaperonin GroES
VVALPFILAGSDPFDLASVEIQNRPFSESLNDTVPRRSNFYSSSISPYNNMFSSAIRASRPLYQRTLSPLGDRILIRKSVKETVTSGGILLPTDNAKDIHEGTVVATGPGIRDVHGTLHALNLKSGDVVLLPKYGGTEVEIGNEKLSLFREEDILGKFD